MPFRDPTSVLILGFIGPFPPSDDVPYVDIGDLDHGRLYIYYDSGSFNIVTEYWIGQDNVDLEIGAASLETDPAVIIPANSTAFGAPRLFISSGEFNNRGDASISLTGRVGAADDAANTSDETPLITLQARYLVFQQQSGSGSAFGVDSHILSRQETEKVTANSAGFTAETVIVTLTNVAVLAGNKYWLKGIVTINSTAAGDDIAVRIRENTGVAGTQLQIVEEDIISTTLQRTVQIEGEYLATADDTGKDFVITCARTGGAGTLNLQASATQPAFFTVDGPYR